MIRSSISVVGLMLMTVAALVQEAAAPATPPASDCSASTTLADFFEAAPFGDSFFVGMRDS